jgi:hypothetical protein
VPRRGEPRVVDLEVEYDGPFDEPTPLALPVCIEGSPNTARRNKGFASARLRRGHHATIHAK